MEPTAMLGRRVHTFVPVILVFALASARGDDARAGYVVDVTESGGDLVFTGSGTINTTALTDENSVHYGGPHVTPFDDQVLFGPVGAGGIDAEYFSGIAGPSSFGPGGLAINIESGTGDPVGLYGSDIVAVPIDYLSGTPMSFSDTATGQTFSEVGLTPGTYTWTWGSGADADFLTISIGTAAVPEPAGFMMLGSGMLAILGYARRGGRGRRQRLSRARGGPKARSPRGHFGPISLTYLDPAGISARPSGGAPRGRGTSARRDRSGAARA